MGAYRGNESSALTPLFASELAGRYLREAVFGPGARHGWEDTLLHATGERLDPGYFVRCIS